MNIENILLRMANEVLDLPNNNLPIGIPIDKARLAIQAEITKARINELEKLNHFVDNPEHAPTFGYLEWDYEKRIAELKGETNE